MSGQAPCTVTIMGKEYRVACNESEKKGLVESARYLDEKMRSLKSGIGMVAQDRLIVIAALNITHELLQSRITVEHLNKEVKNRLSALGKKIESSLSRGDELDL